MRTTKFICHFISVTALFTVTASAGIIGSAFEYQGRLTDGGNPAHGNYDLTFKLFNAVTGPSQIGSTQTNANLAISNGLFMVTLDFGAGVFDGTAYWLQIAARTNGGGGFVNLTPRQPVFPSPYALYATTAGSALTAGTAALANNVAVNGVNDAAVQNAIITANKIASGQVVKSLNGLFDNVSLAAGANVTLTPAGNTITIGSSAWSLTGNGGTTAANFLGTTDGAPLDLRVNNSRGLHLEYFARSSRFLSQYGVNIIGGYWGNIISNNVIGATIAGGGDETSGLFGPAYYPNAVSDDFGAVGGGYGNVAAYAAAVPGGYNNSAMGTGSFAAGRNAHVTHDGSFMWGDGSQAAYSTDVNRFEVLANGGVNFFNGPNGVNVDMLNLNTGDVNYSLRFGYGSGEAIGSKRNAGGNQFGLDFYTGFNNRMSIANWGGVGIGTDSPQQQLDVNGWYLQVRGAGGEDAYMGGDGFGGDVQVGSLNPSIANVAFYNAGSGAYMHVYCKALTITGGADLAEPFEMSSKEIPEGAVVVIDEENPGHLKLSDAAYDSHVAGIVSGAGGINPGIQLQQQGVLEGGQNVALTGRVYALADATRGAIKPGDLLTTSAVPGYCMKASDRDKAQGAILGKAMTGLKDGKGKVLVLVTLQ